MVLRLLQQVSRALDVNTLGMQPLQLADFAHALQQPQGLVLVTGPTGSGKTVTLYSALQTLNTADINICSVEDPVEIPIAGLNQTQIHPRAGLTFQGVLRALLRRDPDVIMIGEIRDGETAEIAIKAAQTGHPRCLPYTPIPPLKHWYVYSKWESPAGCSHRRLRW